MPRQTAQTRADDLVAAFTELGPAWSRWVQTCTPSAAVSYIRMRLLHVLESEGPRTMSELANALAVTPRRVTALVDALEADGLVERRPHPTDGRSTVVSLTRSGHKQQQVIWAERQREISEAFLDLSAEQQRQLLAITPVLTASLRKLAAGRSLADAGCS
ncbi:MAG: MarR family winged helix-turn-helix transcriptional regulator [Solirubrobacteraceae bacterium]